MCEPYQITEVTSLCPFAKQYSCAGLNKPSNSESPTNNTRSPLQVSQIGSALYLKVGFPEFESINTLLKLVEFVVGILIESFKRGTVSNSFNLVESEITVICFLCFFDVKISAN